ncbi:hypothetical protein ACQP3J_29035, partial [Escherichia coli]
SLENMMPTFPRGGVDGFWSFDGLVIDVCHHLGGLVTSCYLSWSGKKLNKGIWFKDRFLKEKRGYCIEMMR